jgi:hypothetical protein
VVKKGYSLNGEVVQHAKVIIGEWENKEQGTEKRENI